MRCSNPERSKRGTCGFCARNGGASTRPSPAPALAACLAAARVNRLADDADFRTPWESGDDGAIVDYELTMIRRSASNMRAIGLGA